MNAALLGQYGEQDAGTTGGVPRLLTALLQYRKSYELHVYQGAPHAFNNDTATSYRPIVACDAWAKTLAFFGRTLSTQSRNVLFRAK